MIFHSNKVSSWHTRNPVNSTVTVLILIFGLRLDFCLFFMTARR